MYDSKLKSEDLDRLFTAVLSLESLEECYMFFEDVCTISELMSISQRLKVAAFLKEPHPCHDISDTVGASTATISRVNRCLNYGTGGYNKVLDRIKEK